VVGISDMTITDVSTENSSRFIKVDEGGDWRIDHCKFVVSPKKAATYYMQ